MFSVFGRTGAFTNRGPTKGAANFCMPELMGDCRVNESDEQKKRSPVFSRKIGSAAPGEKPHIFSKHDPAESKSGPGERDSRT